MGKRPSKTTKRSPGAGRSGGQSSPPPSLQVGALCWRRTKKGALRLLLITSRDTGRWVIPKGWPMRNRSEAEAAAREAWEEAGVIGSIDAMPVGLYSYPKILPKGRAVPCLVRVYALAVSGRRRSFPEAGQRRHKWMSPSKAARRAQEPELARLIRSFMPSPAAAAGPHQEERPETALPGASQAEATSPEAALPEHPVIGS